MPSTIVAATASVASPANAKVRCMCSGRTTLRSRAASPSDETIAACSAPIAARAESDRSRAAKRRIRGRQKKLGKLPSLPSFQHHEPQHVHRRLGGLILHLFPLADELKRSDTCVVAGGDGNCDCPDRLV